LDELSGYFTQHALPGGYRNSDGSFNNVGKNANFWSSSANGSENAWNRNLNYNNGEVNRNNWNRTNGYSVRCLQDLKVFVSRPVSLLATDSVCFFD
jgi:uncharacterized protein (TIGR02145 family)